jgi:outer membrane lipoprotein carrier protein
MEFSDALGQRTVIGFSQWSRNPRFPANTFKFSPPKGVDVLGEVEQGAEVTPLRD